MDAPTSLYINNKWRIFSEKVKQRDGFRCLRIVPLYKNISEFVHESQWTEGHTKKDMRYLSAGYRHHTIRIYGGEGHYAYQLVFKEKGVKWHSYEDVVPLPGRGLVQVKELAYVVLKGRLARDAEERGRLREVYRRLTGRS